MDLIRACSSHLPATTINLLLSRLRAVGGGTSVTPPSNPTPKRKPTVPPVLPSANNPGVLNGEVSSNVLLGPGDVFQGLKAIGSGAFVLATLGHEVFEKLFEDAAKWIFRKGGRGPANLTDEGKGLRGKHALAASHAGRYELEH